MPYPTVKIYFKKDLEWIRCNGLVGNAADSWAFHNVLDGTMWRDCHVKILCLWSPKAEPSWLSAYAPKFLEDWDMNLMKRNHHRRNRKPKTATISPGGRSESRSECTPGNVPSGAPWGAMWLSHFSRTPSPAQAPISLHTWVFEQHQQSRWSECPRSLIWGKYLKHNSQTSRDIELCPCLHPTPPTFSHWCSVFGQWVWWVWVRTSAHCLPWPKAVCSSNLGDIWATWWDN